MRLGVGILFIFIVFSLALGSAMVGTHSAQAQAVEVPLATPEPFPSPPPEDQSPAAQRPIQIPELPRDSRANSQVAYVLRRKGIENRISGLDINENSVPVVLVTKGNDIKPTIAVHGEYSAPGWRLFVVDSAQNVSPLTPPVVPNGKNLASSPFVVYAHLNGRVNEITLFAAGPKGEKKLEKIYVYAPNARAYHVVSPWDDFLLSVGVTNFSYRQTGFGAYESLNALISIKYGSPDSDSVFAIYASAEMTALAFASSPISTAPQTFEGRVDLAIRPWRQVNRYRNRILAGAEYLTMFSNGSPFGFSDLGATEIGWQTRYIASYREDWIYEFRFLPIGGPTHIDQRGLQLSAAWSKLLQDSRRLEMGLSYSSFAWQPDDLNSIQMSVITLRAGLSL